MKYLLLGLGTLVAVCVGCASDGQQLVKNRAEHVAPPASMLSRPGPMVDGPGPGVLPMMADPAGGMAAPPTAVTTTQIRIIGQPGMHVGWQVPEGYAESQIVVPGRYDFPQAASYRLKLTNVPRRDGLVLYPTLQVYPSHPTTLSYLSHNTVPVEITDEDLDQVESNNFVTKVIYLPDPKFQELAIAGVETLVSTRLDPGVDPVAEADRRGTIMVVLRMGNMDLETPTHANHGGGPNMGAAGSQKGVKQVSYSVADGAQGQYVPPMPIKRMGTGSFGTPSPMMVAGGGRPGMPTLNPATGRPMPVWGRPMTSTPIGLPGPPHLPYGGPAGLKSHTVRNLSKNDIPDPVDHMLIDVRHEPGYSLPKPVKHVEYTERHPVFSPGELSYPASTGRTRGDRPPVPAPGYHHVFEPNSNVLGH